MVISKPRNSAQGIPRRTVYYQAELTDTPEIVPFSATPNGPANLASAFTETSPVALYIDAVSARGFYSVALVATPY